MLEATFWGDRLMAADFVPYRMGADFAPRVVPRGAARPASSTRSGSSASLASHATEQPADPAQLSRVDDGRHVGGRVVAGVRRAADPRREEARRRRTTRGRWRSRSRRPSRIPSRVGHVRQPVAQRRRACPSTDDSGTTVPTPTRSSETIARRLRARRRRAARRTPSTRSGAGRRARAAPRRRTRPARPGRCPPAPGPSSSSTAIPDALSSAPGATRDGVEVRADQRRTAPPGRSRPGSRSRCSTGRPSTGTPHESPAGTGNDCRRTSYPSAREARSSTYAAASPEGRSGREPRADRAGEVADRAHRPGGLEAPWRLGGGRRWWASGARCGVGRRGRSGWR